jgi:formylglycine-generating enzyme required for sulfatase activity
MKQQLVNIPPLRPPGLSATDLAIEFLPIRAGSFRMGQRGVYADEEPVQWVSIAEDFYLARYPVTQAQFAAWTQTPAYQAWFAVHREEIRQTSNDNQAEPHTNRFADNPSHPAERVTWWEACGYAEWLNAQGQLPAGWIATLPNEAQWEYACRAGTTTAYWSGDEETDLARVGWYAGNADGKTHAVDEKLEPNAWGLVGMHGNVWEWCLDYFDATRYRRRVDGESWQTVGELVECEPEGANPDHVAWLALMQRFATGELASLKVAESDIPALDRLKSRAQRIVDNGDNSWAEVLDAVGKALAKKQLQWPEAHVELAKELKDIFQNWVDQASGRAASRVLRGGSWSTSATFCRAAYRFRDGPGYRNRFFGFRLAVVPGPPAPVTGREASTE